MLPCVAIQLRAQGCPVVIVGTHMDKLKDKRVMELEETAKEKYVKSSTNSAYPHVRLYAFACKSTGHEFD